MAILRSDTRLTDKLVRHYVTAGYWKVPTYPELLAQNAVRHGDQIAIVDEHRAITWEQLWVDARKLAGHFLELGLCQGDVVGLQLPNRIEYVIALAAANLVGAVACPYLVNLRATEVKFILGFSRAVVAIVPKAVQGDFDLGGMLHGLRSELPRLKQIIAVGEGEPPTGSVSLQAILDGASDSPGFEKKLKSRSPDVSDVSRILFTSGSTGDPKGVIHTHGTTIYNNIRFNEYLRMSERSAMLVFIPVTLNLGMFHVIQAALVPCRLILLESFEPEKVIRCIERWQITNFASPPTGLIAILRDPFFSKEKVKSLKFVISGGTPCAIDLQQQLRDGLGCSLLDGYGMTEAGWISATAIDDTPAETEGTVGFPFPWMFVRICDEDGHEVPLGTVGEITIGGPSICVGYYNAPQRNAESWTSDNRFRTGDLGFLDAKGRLRIVGRAKDLIKHGGISIYPRDLEELLIAHPKIAEVAIIGVPDPYFGENACACIVPKNGAQISLEEVIGFLKDRIAKYKLPQQLERFDRLPYTATGKIQRHILRQTVEARTSQKPVVSTVAPN